MKRLFLAFLWMFVLSVPVARAERPRMTAQEAYELGLRYLKNGSYTKALEQLNRVRTYYRDDPYALKAELAIADVHFKKAEWDAARLAYEDFQRAHPRYRDLDYVVYQLGLTLFKKAPLVAARDQTATREAVDEWTGFGPRFPESEWRDEVEKGLMDARNRLARKELLVARFYERRAAWAAVVGRTEALLRDYPQSADRIEALGLLGRGYAGLGRTEQARQVVERLRIDAPGSREIADVEKAIAEAEEAAAEKAAAEAAAAPPVRTAP